MKSGKSSNTNFNSIKVRLEHEIVSYILSGVLFQFHKGTIRTIFAIPRCRQYKYFNSIKVRLERLVLFPVLFYPSFQFHKGTIRTLLRYFFYLLAKEFQFHKGTIRTNPYPTLCRRLVNFNSIKVRLELLILCYIHQRLQFQFHKGTIRTKSR